MAAKPLTNEIIALTEKKMDMTLDEIIKMGKGNGNKAKKQRRPANKNQSFLKTAVQDKSAKVRRYIDSRSSVRQGFLAQRRSNFQGNQFPLTKEVARKAASAPFGNRAFAYNQVVANWKPRVGAPPVPRRPGNGKFASKSPQHPHQQQHQVSMTEMPKQRPQTLDSLFANMKEERMRALSNKNNGAGAQAQRNRGGRQRPPWSRARFRN